MSVLGGISGREAVKKFQSLGYHVVRQKGSHVRLAHANDLWRRPLTIPLHRELKKGLARQLMQDAGVSIEEFIGL